MTSTTTKTVSKVAAIVAASALVAMSVVIAPAAHADTTTTSTTMTSSQVAALQAQIASLQAQLSAASGTATTVTFTRDLTIGSTGSDVTALQTWLIAKGYSIPAGATGYFGAQTRSALGAYQAANGISPTAGYFGPVTRAKVNASATTTTTTTTTTTGGTTTTTTGTTLGGGEGSIDNFKSVGASSSSLNAGDNEQVIGFEFKADGSDLQVNRIDYDVYKSSLAGGSVRPWNVLQTAILMDGNTTIASLDASNQNNWSEDGTAGNGNQIYRLRFDNLKDVVKMGNTADYYLSFTSQNAVSNSNQGATYTVSLASQGLRATDAMGIQQYSPSGNNVASATFSVSNDTNGSAVLSQGSDNPQTTTVQGNQASQTSNVVLNTFTIQAKSADLELYTLPVVLSTTGAASSTQNPGVLIRDVKLYQGSTLIDTESPSSSMTTGQTLNFTNLNFKIPSGTTASFSIQADINKIDGQTVQEGSTVKADVSTGGAFDIENSSGNTVTITGASTGNVITFRSVGLSADSSPTTSATATLSSAGAGTAQTGTFTFTFNVTAFGQDIFLASTSAAYGGSNNGSYGLVVYDYTAGNATSSTANPNYSSSMTSTADRSPKGNYVIHSGQTKQVTVQATLSNGSGHYYYAVLKNLYFDTSDLGTATSSSITLPTSYQTGQVRISS